MNRSLKGISFQRVASTDATCCERAPNTLRTNAEHVGSKRPICKKNKTFLKANEQKPAGIVIVVCHMKHLLST